jgi:hypothetical protein
MILQRVQMSRYGIEQFYSIEITGNLVISLYPLAADAGSLNVPPLQAHFSNL